LREGGEGDEGGARISVAYGDTWFERGCAVEVGRIEDRRHRPSRFAGCLQEERKK